MLPSGPLDVRTFPYLVMVSQAVSELDSQLVTAGHVFVSRTYSQTSFAHVHARAYPYVRSLSIER